MKSTLLMLAAAAALASCATKADNQACNCGCPDCPATAQEEVAGEGVTVVTDLPMANLADFPTDADGYIALFDGKTFNGWRGYGRDSIPGRWVIEDNAIKFNGSGTGEGPANDGGDIIFAHPFKNFELEFDYKISEGGNSGVFYLGREVKDNATGRFLPIWQSAPEFQVLDNERHPDAKLGRDNNRQSASLYDMIPAVPQPSKPAGEWNTAKIMVYKGTVVHSLNGQNVVEYHLWTPQWEQMLKDSKFRPGGDFPYAFELLNNLGGDEHLGYIGLQDHGDDVWYRNIRVKELD